MYPLVVIVIRKLEAYSDHIQSKQKDWKQDHYIKTIDAALMNL